MLTTSIYIYSESMCSIYINRHITVRYKVIYLI